MQLKSNDDSKAGIDLKTETKCQQESTEHAASCAPELLLASRCLLDQQGGMMLFAENPFISLWGLGLYSAVNVNGNELSKWHLPPLPICKHGIFLCMCFSPCGGSFLQTQQRLDPCTYFHWTKSLPFQEM